MTTNNILHLDGMTFDKINDGPGKRVYNPSTSKFTTISEQVSAEQKWVDEIFEQALLLPPVERTLTYDFSMDIQNSMNETNDAIMRMLQEELEEEQAALQGFLSQKPMSVLNWAAEDFFNMGSLDTQMDLFKEQTLLTGYEVFDNTFGGFTLGTLNVIAGRSGAGRSRLLMGISKGFIESEELVMLISPTKSLQRLVADMDLPEGSNSSCVSMTTIDPIDLLSAVVEKLESDVANQCRIKAIAIDDLNLYGSSDPESDEYLMLIRELKSIAEDFNVAIICTVPLAMTPHHDGGALWCYEDAVLMSFADSAFELKSINGSLTEVRMCKSRNTANYSQRIYFNTFHNTFTNK
jgi:hypothetical protein